MTAAAPEALLTEFRLSPKHRPLKVSVWDMEVSQ